jgi:hypothetical protein
METTPMKPERLRLILIGIAAVVIGFNVWMYYTWPDLPLLPCENTEVSRAPSPDGKLDAVLFTRRCSGTKSVGSQVSVIEAGAALPNKSGNAFVSNGGKVRAEWGGPKVSLAWTGPAALSVTRDATAEVYKSESRVAEATIAYRAD